MKKHYLFRVKDNADKAYAELLPLLDDLYETEDPETHHIEFGGYAQTLDLATLQHSILIETTDAIDWTHQWEQFAPAFKDGVAHIDLDGGLTLFMQPGPGFGDFSHPTTRLVLSLMKPKNCTVIDIGCGSGILSCTAVLLGAKRALGIDIDPEAILHSQANAIINSIEDKTHFALQLPTFSNEKILIVMNMISSEQKIAWASLPQLHSCRATIITSGILIHERETYLSLTTNWGWILEESIQEEEWMGFKFLQLPTYTETT